MKRTLPFTDKNSVNDAVIQDGNRNSRLTGWYENLARSIHENRELYPR